MQRVAHFTHYSVSCFLCLITYPGDHSIPIHKELPWQFLFCYRGVPIWWSPMDGYLGYSQYLEWQTMVQWVIAHRHHWMWVSRDQQLESLGSRTAGSFRGFTLDLLDWDLHFKMIPRGFVCTFSLRSAGSEDGYPAIESLGQEARYVYGFDRYGQIHSCRAWFDTYAFLQMHRHLGRTLKKNPYAAPHTLKASVGLGCPWNLHFIHSRGEPNVQPGLGTSGQIHP